MCNASFHESLLPLTQRNAVVTSRLKKPGSDALDVNNYRPISNLSFMLKSVERLVCQQLIRFHEKHTCCQTINWLTDGIIRQRLLFWNCIQFTFCSRKRWSDAPWLLLTQSTMTSYSNDFVCRSAFVERLYLGSAPSSTKGCKPSLPMARCPKRHRSQVVLLREASSVWFCSCSTRQTWHVSSRCTESTFICCRHMLRLIIASCHVTWQTNRCNKIVWN